MKTSLESMDIIKEMAKNGNPNSVSDAGVGALCARSAVIGGYLNVKINCKDLTDKKLVNKFLNIADKLKESAIKLEEDILKITLEKFNYVVKSLNKNFHIIFWYSYCTKYYMIYEIIQNIQLTILQRVRLIRHLYIGASILIGILSPLVIYISFVDWNGDGLINNADFFDPREMPLSYFGIIDKTSLVWTTLLIIVAIALFWGGSPELINFLKTSNKKLF